MSPRLRSARLALSCALIAAAAVRCSAPDDDGGGGDSGLRVVQSPRTVLAYEVSWTTSAAMATELHVACQGLEAWTISDDTATKDHEVFVMGLVSGKTCTLTAKGGPTDGGAAELTKRITVDDLPGYLPSTDVVVEAKEGAVAPGWTLLNLSNGRQRVPYIVALLDDKGRYRWYYQYPTTRWGEDTPVIEYKDGVAIGGRDIPMSYVTWRGTIVWKGPSGHHEMRPALAPGRFYTLDEYTCPSFDNFGDQIIEYDLAAQKTTWKWKLCEHYKPPKDVYDWSHMNSVSIFPDKKYLLASSRNQNAVFKIDRTTGKLLWVLGFGGSVKDGFDGDFTVAAADRFYRQHDATVLPNGHILMFDNGLANVRGYSRGLELAYTYDPSGTSKARVVWQYRHEPDIFAPIWGGAQRLDNGNTLLCFGQRHKSKLSTLVEASSKSKTVWELRIAKYWGVYRAQRIAPKRGFVVEQ